MNAFPVFVGYDSREPVAYNVAVESLLAHTSIPLHVQPLDVQALRRSTLYRRSQISGDNPDQLVDELYGETHTTEFTYTRYLVPALCQWRGAALYCDCDLLFREDLAELVDLFDSSRAVQVVKHNHAAGVASKMWGVEQRYYARKNWSSVMLINCEAPGWQYLTPWVVNQSPKRWLHGLTWLEDSEIGELPTGWNWLSGVSDPIPDESINAVHFTLGTPDLAGHEDSPYASEWLAYV